MNIAEGTRLGSYEITSLLGSGGMGQVYRARDHKLGRDVAIKVLREELASNPERLRRFEQEARSASALNHPNIITIHDIRLRQGYGGQVGDEEDVDFIVMEYVEGKTLREILAEGSLPTKKLLQLATQIAEGLAKAHFAGIVHRDLKPENLMVTSDGYVKILDFGLAKLLPQPGVDSEAATITKEGTVAGAVMGTASYMSPEQALGKPLDARTDVFSLGAVLYEMATGTRAFQGKSTVGLFNEILNKTPLSPSSLNPLLPRSLDKIAAKALEKDSAKRYSSAKELLAELHSVRLEPTHLEAEGQKSIVVLPFENMSPDPEQEYFCDGMTEEIISDLSKVEALRVISRSSAMTFKGTKKKVREIADDVSVQYVLEGSVRKAGNNLRITAQLIDASNDAHLWTEKYSGTLDDVFDIQEKVSRSIVDALKVKLTPRENKKLAERPIENVQAYECYLKARQEMLRGTAEGLERALRDLEVGLEIVGENALIYMGLAEAHIFHYEYGIKADEETLQKVEEFTDKVVRLQPDSADSYYLLGRIERYRGSMVDAVKHLDKAVSIDPNHTNALMFLGIGLAYQIGKNALAEPLIRKLARIDPLTPLSLLCQGFFQWMAGYFDEALSTFQKISKVEPELMWGRVFGAYVLAWKGDHDQACTLIDEMLQLAPQDFLSPWALFFKYALKGERNRALDALSEDVRRFAWNDPEFPWLGASTYALLEEKDEALKWLEHAVNRGWTNYPLFFENDPFLESIRGEERFKKLMERVKYEWEHFEV